MTDYISAMHVLSERLAENALDLSNINDLRTMAEWLLEQNEIQAAAELSDLANYLVAMREELYKKGQNWLPVISAAEKWFRSDYDKSLFTSNEILKDQFKTTFEHAAKQSNDYKEMIACLKSNKMGDFIKAVKLYRTIFRVGLLEARDAIQKLKLQVQNEEIK